MHYDSETLGNSIEEALASPEIHELVGAKIDVLRKRLLDSSRRNPLINIRFRSNSTSILRVVDELPDVLRFNLTNGNPMRLAPLPALEQALPDEQTDEFVQALYFARQEDDEFLSDVEKIDQASEKAEGEFLRIERALKDRIREELNLPPRQTKEDLSLTMHAKIHGISPSYSLPMPGDEHEDGRHNDKDIQTLMLPDRLTRVAKGILAKGHSFERETGVNVLHATFGLLEWKDPAEHANFVSPLLLLEIRIEREQSPIGAQFFVAGIDKALVNTTLAQKLLAEHGLTLPNYEASSVDDYFAEVQEKAPTGWHWKVRREVTFGIFPSSKIAMYHDLDPEKRPISDNPVLAKLLASSGAGDGSYAEVYEIDNPEVAKKVPYLVLDADASQYSALVDAADGQNLAIEGPPGSGKSQSIVNLIAAALADSKKVLFVAEKLAALDVVKKRLEATGLGEFILPLQAGRGTQMKIYESLKERLAIGRGTIHPQTSFESRQRALENRRAILQNYLDTLASDFGTSGMTVYQTIGHGIATAETREEVPKEVRRIRLERPENLDPESIETIVSDAELFAERLGKIRRMPKLWRESDAAIVSQDDAEDTADAAGQLATDMESFARDFAACDLARPTLTQPFSVDMEEIGKILQAIATEVDHVDPALVEALIDPVRRRAVQTLCRQIQERQRLLALLSRVLCDPESWNVDERLVAARNFAAEHRRSISPESHNYRLAKIEKKISRSKALTALARQLPDSWGGRTDQLLSSIQKEAQELLMFPEAVRAVRQSDAECQANELATALVETAQQLVAELAEIKRGLPKAGNHDPAQMRRNAQTILSSGVLRFLSGEYKNARDIYCHVLGGQMNDDRPAMVRQLEAYAAWLDKRSAFESNSRFKTAFGALFNGLATDLALIAQAADFHKRCQEIAAGDAELQRMLEAGDLTHIATFAAANPVPDMILSDIEDYISAQTIEQDKEKILLVEAEGFIGLFKERTSIKLEELDDIVAKKNEEAQLTQRIQASPAASILGIRFAGIETNTDQLQVECTLASTLATAPDPAFAICILGNGTAQQLLDELNHFQERRKKIENDSAGLWTLLNLPESLRSAAALFGRVNDLREAATDPNALLDRAQLKRSEDALRNHGFDALVDWAVEKGDAFDSEQLALIARAIIAKNMVDRAYSIHAEALRGYDGQDFSRIREEIAQKDRDIIRISQRVIRSVLLNKADPPAGINFGKKSNYTNMGLIINEMSKKQRHIGVRELTKRAGAALLELKPCWMMSPLAVAQYVHDGMEFDIVVIDEASQMTPENAVGALSRAKQVVVVGDTKQLPPTSFFQKMLDEGDNDEDLREDSESILDMANVAFMPVRQFRWHYRSRHPALIQFSNTWLYKGDLTIFPAAQEDHPSLGVKLVEVNGVYKSRKNEIEARVVISTAVEHMTTSPELSLGICTMNSDQKDLIIEEFERVRDRDPRVQAYVSKWEKDADGLEEFFIKNLETIQGDERDVMFISTLYGPEIPGGRVLQRFGPINSIHGHRRLNVLFSRAKRKMVTFTSMNPTDILVDDNKNQGVMMFRAWLEYCKTGRIAETAALGGETESPFEDYVARQIEAMGCTVVPQVGVAGFRIDLGVRHPDWPYGYILGVECDGATYHSSKSSRDRDRLRQEVLEDLGWKLHRIWSTDWFRNPRAEIETLREVIEEARDIAKKRSAASMQQADTTSAVPKDISHSVEPVSEIPERVTTRGSKPTAAGHHADRTRSGRSLFPYQALQNPMSRRPTSSTFPAPPNRSLELVV